MAEQLGFEQIGAEGRAVHGQQRTAPPRAGGMQSLRDQFLAAAGLAFDQDRERRVGELIDERAQGHHAGAHAEQEVAARRTAHLLELFGFQQHQLMLEPRAQQGGLAGLGHEIDRAQGQRMLNIAPLVLT